VSLLETPRLRLRAWDHDDAEAFLDIYSRTEVAKWLGAHPRQPLTSLDGAVARINTWNQLASQLASPLGLWAIVPGVAEPAVPVGTVLLVPLADESGGPEEIEIGWHLHPHHQGKGLATESAQALLHAAAAAEIRTVIALTDLDNVRSQAVAVRLGMKDEGTTNRWYGVTTRQYRLALPPPS
jgi:RimJ/RimL family protein N-acetyltransferase